MSADVREAAGYLRQLQNSDGGWGFRAGGSSWTEATCYALLALRGDAGAVETQRGLAWLQKQQLADGGWSPRPGVAQSTWVTALALAALHASGKLQSGDPGLRWLSESAGVESGWLNRLRQFLLGSRQGYETGDQGWPWYPGAAAWVAPTAMTIVALRSILAAFPDAALRNRLEQGKAFLLARRCTDGGWNHGSSRALGYDSSSYPETTGQALLALRGDARAQSGLARARQHATACRSVETWCWLQMGLWAHGAQTVPQPADLRLHDAREAALLLLAQETVSGRDPFDRR